MTSLKKYQIQCGRCGNSVDVEIYHSVNVTTDPGLLDKVKKRKINNYECSKCGEKTDLVYQFLFVDMKNKLWIWCYSEQMRENRLEIEKELANSKATDFLMGIIDQRPILVFGYDELLEKLK